MMRADELVAAIAALEMADLEAWVREALVAAEDEAGTLVFSDSEAARVRLIASLRYDMEVETGTLPVVLSLMDQLYETRRRLNALGAAVAAQENAVREAILTLLGEG